MFYRFSRTWNPCKKATETMFCLFSRTWNPCKKTMETMYFHRGIPPRARIFDLHYLTNPPMTTSSWPSRSSPKAPVGSLVPSHRRAVSRPDRPNQSPGLTGWVGSDRPRIIRPVLLWQSQSCVRRSQVHLGFPYHQHDIQLQKSKLFKPHRCPTPKAPIVDP